MDAITRLIISIIFGVSFVALIAEDKSEHYYHVISIWGYLITIGIFSAISLYSSKSYDIKYNKTGEPIPVFILSSKNREIIGKWVLFSSFIIFISFLVISSTMDSKEAYEFAVNYESIILGPVSCLVPIGMYLFITRKCIYCGVLNTPKTNMCKKCNYELPAHAMAEYIDEDA